MKLFFALSLTGIVAVSGFQLPKVVEHRNGVPNQIVSGRMRTSSILQARKIDDENSAMNKDSKPKGKKGKKGSESENKLVDVNSASAASELVVGAGSNEFTADASRSIFGNEPTTSGPAALKLPEAESEVRIGDRLLSKVEVDKMDSVIAAATANAENIERDVEMRVPKSDPLKQSVVPPEIVFFGDPRKPPPVEAARDVKYHGTLLFWARHATIAPRTSDDRLATVFPKGRLHPNAPKFRLQSEGLTYKKIFDGFVQVMDDLDDSKSFINANIDLVPSKLFLRALTAQKLSAQSNNDLEQMDFLKEVRRRYILAGDQVFFPLNIEVQKAETRVMTYLARDELRSFAENWDEVEMSLHFSTLLSARLTWDSRVKELLDDIKRKIKETVGYMAENMRDDLMNREFRKPGVTAELYTNASLSIQREMPELYARIRPEIRFAHEAFFIQDESEIRRFATKDFCFKNSLSPDQLKERLKIYDASLGAVQGVDYIRLRLYMQNLYRILCEPKEYEEGDKWFTDAFENGFGFETYEPDTVPTMIALEQRIRDTGNAFTNFNTQVLKRPTKYTEAFSGMRPKGASVGNWLERDPEYHTEAPASYQERIEAFRTAYITQSGLRQEAESRLMTIVVNRMDSQDRALKGSSFSNIEEYEE